MLMYKIKMAKARIEEGGEAPTGHYLAQDKF
jgi:hypothetical protein